MKTRKILSREIVVDDQWVTIIKERIEDETRGVEEYHIISLGDTAMVLAITEDGKVPMVREYRYGCQDYVWQLPAGKIGENETALEAAQRELLEETGYGAESWEFLASWYISSPRMPDRQFVFVATGAHRVKELNPGDIEDIALGTVSWEKAVKMVLAGEIKDPHSCVAILWIDKRRTCES